MLRKNFLIVIFSSVCFLGGVVGTSQATTMNYDPTSDFSLTNGNPNGVWSYGWMEWQNPVFTAFTPHSSTYSDSNITLWYEPGLSPGHPPLVGLNQGTTNFGIAPHHLTLHPWGNLAAVIRFTAQFDGIYSAIGGYGAGDGGSTSLGVRQANNWLWQGTDAGAFSLQNISLSAGGTMDFVVYGAFSGGHTQLDLVLGGTLQPLFQPPNQPPNQPPSPFSA